MNAAALFALLRTLSQSAAGRNVLNGFRNIGRAANTGCPVINFGGRSFESCTGRLVNPGGGTAADPSAAIRLAAEGSPPGLAGVETVIEGRRLLGRPVNPQVASYARLLSDRGVPSVTIINQLLSR